MSEGADDWTALLPCSAVGKAPQRVEVRGVKLAVWRTRHGRPVVFVDRCPHQDVPLSNGRRTFTGHLVCDGHGWEFDASGACVHAPGRKLADLRGRRATVVPCREADGRLWVLLADVPLPDVPLPDEERP